jgi:hypothetical protein
MRSHQASEVGELHLTTLAVEAQPAELGFELLDGVRERRLGDMALRRGLVEVQGRAHEARKCRTSCIFMTPLP